MITPSDVLFWYGITMYLVNAIWCFPDSAISKKYILAKAGDGSYALVPEESKMPGLHVSSKEQHVTTAQPDKLSVKPDHISPPTAPRTASTPVPATHHSLLPNIHLVNNKGNIEATQEENLVTLALQGRDGINGRPGAKGPRGESGPTGSSGLPGLRGEPGACSIHQFQCDVNLIKKLAVRVTQLEKVLAKIQKPSGGLGN